MFSTFYLIHIFALDKEFVLLIMHRNTVWKNKQNFPSYNKFNKRNYFTWALRGTSVLILKLLEYVD